MDNPQTIWWECLHCEQQQPTTEPYPPFFCRCGRRDWKLVKPTTIELATSALYLNALFRTNKSKGREAIAELLIGRFSFKTITGTKNEKIWVYQDGIYTPKGWDIIKQETEKILENEATNSQVAEIIGKIARKTIVKQSDLDQKNPYLICVKNGIVDLRDGTFNEHTPDVVFTNQLPIAYNERADCPKIKKILAEVLEHEDIPTFLEFAGYCLLKEYKYKKAVLLLGQRDSGKTLLLNLLTAFLGEENIAGESLQKIIGDRFSAFNLIGKYANFYDDLSARDFYDAGAFKVATGGGYINAEQKFSDAVRYKNTAKLAFATNEVALPKESADDAYYSRWLVFRFLQQFSEGGKKTNKKLLTELTTPEELSGLLRIAVKSFQRLERHQAFSYKKTPEQVKLIMHESGDVISAFAQNCLIETPDGLISKEVMHLAFLAWCKHNNRMVVTKDLLGKRLQLAAPYISEGRRVLNGKKTPCWVNVSFNNKDISIIPFLKSIFTIDTTLKSCNGREIAKDAMNKNEKNEVNLTSTNQKQLKMSLFDYLTYKKEVTIKEAYTEGYTQEEIDFLKKNGDIILRKAGYLTIKDF
jgi:P4 family phage/plasmid primase-like protien